ncbi:MAG: 4a-hydroxytetrahydrobiopterin dehydratase [Spirochaetia bacterium]|nr:4a-hydroxytetrahydrobiopterin dehydratase [Spirochaetia bacterium]
MKRPEVLKEDEILRYLDNLKNWERLDGKIYARFSNFESYRKTIDCVIKISYIVEDLDHHPEIRIGYNELQIYSSTHQPKGLTMLDFKLAEEINKLLL